MTEAGVVVLSYLCAVVVFWGEGIFSVKLTYDPFQEVDVGLCRVGVCAMVDKGDNALFKINIYFHTRGVFSCFFRLKKASTSNALMLMWPYILHKMVGRTIIRRRSVWCWCLMYTTNRRG